MPDAAAALEHLLLTTMRRLRERMRPRLDLLPDDAARAKVLADAVLRELRDDERAIALMRLATEGSAGGTYRRRNDGV